MIQPIHNIHALSGFANMHVVLQFVQMYSCVCSIVAIRRRHWGILGDFDSRAVAVGRFEPLSLHLP